MSRLDSFLSDLAPLIEDAPDDLSQSKKIQWVVSTHSDYVQVIQFIEHLLVWFEYPYQCGYEYSRFILEYLRARVDRSEINAHLDQSVQLNVPTSFVDKLRLFQVYASNFINGVECYLNGISDEYDSLMCDNPGFKWAMQNLEDEAIEIERLMFAKACVGERISKKDAKRLVTEKYDLDDFVKRLNRNIGNMFTKHKYRLSDKIITSFLNRIIKRVRFSIDGNSFKDYQISICSSGYQLGKDRSGKKLERLPDELADSLLLNRIKSEFGITYYRYFKMLFVYAFRKGYGEGDITQITTLCHKHLESGIDPELFAEGFICASSNYSYFYNEFMPLAAQFCHPSFQEGYAIASDEKKWLPLYPATRRLHTREIREYNIPDLVEFSKTIIDEKTEITCVIMRPLLVRLYDKVLQRLPDKPVFANNTLLLWQDASKSRKSRNTRTGPSKQVRTRKEGRDIADWIKDEIYEYYTKRAYCR